MFSDQMRQEVALYIEREARAYLSFRSSLFNLQKEIFTDLAERRNSQFTELESAIEQLALVQIELSEGVFNNIYNGQIIAGIGLAAWQQQLAVKAMQFCYQDGVFRKWSEGGQIEPTEVRTIALEAHRQQVAAGIRDKSIASSEWYPIFTEIGQMHALDAQKIEQLYMLSSTDTLDDALTGFMRTLLNLDVRVCFEMAALSLHLLVTATAGTDERSGSMSEILRTVEAGIAELAAQQ